jgi:hypothetical protein
LPSGSFGSFRHIVVAHRLGEFVADIDPQLSDTIDTCLLLVLLMAVNGKLQTVNESSQYLRHEAMRSAGDQVIHIEVQFPLPEEYLDFPSELADKGNVLRGQVKTAKI